MLLALSARAEDLQVLLISVTFGNVGVQKLVANNKSICLALQQGNL